MREAAQGTLEPWVYLDGPGACPILAEADAAAVGPVPPGPVKLGLDCYRNELLEPTTALVAQVPAVQRLAFDGGTGRIKDPADVFGCIRDTPGFQREVDRLLPGLRALAEV